MSKTFISVIVVVLFIGAFLAFNKYMSNARGYNMTNTQSLNGNIKITPIEHATMVLKWEDKVIYTDPEGGMSAFKNQPAPDLILLTDIHPDHLDLDTLRVVSKEKTIIIAPMAVADMLPDTILGTLLVMKNGQKTNQKTSQKINLQGFNVEAVAMYNLPESKDSYHVKGRGNGYVIKKEGKRVYISGDTSDTPEMRSLKNIDIAFVCMNLPYTMSVEEAASGVLAFKPKQVYPYHYRGTDGLSNVSKFKELVNKGNPNIDVILLDWYSK